MAGGDKRSRLLDALLRMTALTPRHSLHGSRWRRRPGRRCCASCRGGGWSEEVTGRGVSAPSRSEPRATAGTRDHCPTSWRMICHPAPESRADEGGSIPTVTAAFPEPPGYTATDRLQGLARLRAAVRWRAGGPGGPRIGPAEFSVLGLIAIRCPHDLMRLAGRRREPAMADRARPHRPCHPQPPHEAPAG